MVRYAIANAPYDSLPILEPVGVKALAAMPLS